MEKKIVRHIAVAGNIASGKTTLTRLLSSHYKWTPIFEKIEENPYLHDFYQDMSRWSFELQIYFLHTRLKQFIEWVNRSENVIQDRTIYEDVYVFARCLNEMGLLSERDFATYKNLFETIKELITPPTLIIYLKSSIPNLVKQIQNRGRPYEENIRVDYLKKLGVAYDKWVAHYKDGALITIDVDKNNFEGDNFKAVVNQIDTFLNTL